MSTKTTILLIIATTFMLTSCNTTKLVNTSLAGHFKVAIFYQAGEDKTFDMDYYEQKHMPMVAALIGKNLKYYEIDKGISGRTSNDKALYVAIGYFIVKDIAEYNKAIGANRETIISDFKNYTNIQPVIQISEIKKIGYHD